jgi:hypothetical protein
MIIRLRCLLIALLAAGSIVAHADCDLTSVDVEITKSSWYNRCSKRNCAVLRGTATLTSRCEQPIAVQVGLSGLDSDGDPVVEKNRWPHVLRAVSAGNHEFSLDKWLMHDPEIKRFRLDLARVRVAEQ